MESEFLDLKGNILTPTSGPEFTKALERNSLLSDQHPKYILVPEAFTDIPPILEYAKAQRPALPVAVKGGGAHTSTWAGTKGGIIIDLARLNAVQVAEDGRSVLVQGGALWGDVYAACREAQVDVVGGPFWFVGVGGYLTGGGYSPFSPQRGLGIDNIISAKVILADGRIVRASATKEPDLFWAIRGGGNQFGIVVEYTLKAFPTAGPFTVGELIYPGSQIENVLKTVQEWKQTYTPREKLNITFARPGPSFAPVVSILPWVSEDAGGRSKNILAPFRELQPVRDTCGPVPDMLAVSHALDGLFAAAPSRLCIRGALVEDLWDDMIMGLWERWLAFTEEHEDARSTTVLCELANADKIAQVGVGETAFHARTPHYWVAIQGRSTTEQGIANMRAFAASATAYIKQTNRSKTGRSPGCFLNFAQGDERIEEVHGPNLPRLRKLKAKYDPKKLWSTGCIIEPDFHVARN